MVGEQIQNYVNLVGGLTRATRSKASEAAQGLLAAAGLDDVAADAGERVTNLAEEIIAASRANRELLVKLVNTEVDKAAAKIGFARAEDLESLRGEVAELRAVLTEQSARAQTAEAAATEATVVAAAAAVAAEEAATSAEEAAVSAEEAVAAPVPAKKGTCSQDLDHQGSCHEDGHEEGCGHEDSRQEDTCHEEGIGHEEGAGGEEDAGHAEGTDQASRREEGTRDTAGVRVTDSDAHGAPGDESVTPPTTGLPAVDEALGRLSELEERPVSEHPDALAAAHETLHTSLEAPTSGPHPADGSTDS